MADKLKLRIGRFSDSEELLGMLNSSSELQASEEGNTYTKEWIDDALKDKKKNIVLIAEENRKIIGFLVSEIWLRKRYSFLNDIYIAPEYRQKGIATKLMDEYENRCEKLNIRAIIGLVLTTNEKMHKFKEKLGYKRGSAFYLYEKRL